MLRCKNGYKINDDGTIPSRCHVDWDGNFYPTTCKECPYYNEEFDRDTALSILKEFSRDMYPSYDLYGNKTLVINRDKFEAIRTKYLDRRE